MENALRVRLDFMVFTGFDINETLPDETTICRYKNVLIKLGIDKVVFNEINKELERLELKVERASGAVIDATIVKSAARPNKVVNIEKDRQESGKEVTIEESKDKDAKWLKKGNKSYFGYKGLGADDLTDGYIF
ncbi:MAG: transposase [Nitrospirae bacterium]|nr:transposase [Nitrospirota bacterium]